MRAHARGRPLAPSDAADLVDAAWEAVLANASDAPRADPALVAVPRRLPAKLYYEAVRTLVPLERVDALLASRGAVVRTRGSRLGVVGAAAAVAWPGRRVTWERLHYRRPSRIGLPRRVSERSVREAQRRDPRLFLCYDEGTRRLLVAPHTNCPILYGLRATAPSALARAAGRVRSEAVDRWMLFRTNQGTGDHLVDLPVWALGPYAAGRVRGRVAGAPVTLPGGHVRFPLEDRAGTRLECLVFEPTKDLTDVARSLRPGDPLRVWGGRGEDPVLRVEGIVVEGPSRRERRLPPRCPDCGTRAKSLGRARGFRCRGCRRRWPPEASAVVEASARFPPGTYHPTPSARRHLAPVA